MTNPSPLTRTAAASRRAEVRRILLALAAAHDWLAFPAAEGGRWFRALSQECGLSEKQIETIARECGLWPHDPRSVWAVLKAERDG